MTKHANARIGDPRIRVWNGEPVRPGGAYVVYWCQAVRRAVDNVALELAIERANELGLPVVVYEALRPDYPWASDRLHRFILECARDTSARCGKRGIAHGFFLPRTAHEARGVAAKVFADAAMVVSDEHPSCVFPAQNAAAARHVSCAYLTVEDNTVVPMALIPGRESQARTIRRKMLDQLDEWSSPVREVEPRRGPSKVDWPVALVDLAGADLERLIARCEIDHQVAPVIDRPGGARAARTRLAAFMRTHARGYDEGRDDVPADSTSGLSPYLHFGAISARACVIAARAAHLPKPSLDAFIEQLVVRRGLSFNHAARVSDHASYASLPEWSRQTLARHESDPRPEACDVAALERAQSGDDLWNAAQSELLRRGRIHNVMRMFWGKRLLQLVRRPQEAFDFGVRMFDRYALDGRDPNTYAGVGWCFGLHDRPFPERPIFGTVRPMGRGALKKRFDIDDYLRELAAAR